MYFHLALHGPRISQNSKMAEAKILKSNLDFWKLAKESCRSRLLVEFVPGTVRKPAHHNVVTMSHFLLSWACVGSRGCHSSRSRRSSSICGASRLVVAVVVAAQQ